jgi:hypothetical protein
MKIMFFSGLAGAFGLAGWSREDGEAQEGETTGGDDEPVDWVPVAIALGRLEAAIIVGRLDSEGIPARIQQEGVGSALTLYVGVGQIHVLVPKPLADRAIQALESPVEPDE